MKRLFLLCFLILSVHGCGKEKTNSPGGSPPAYPQLTQQNHPRLLMSSGDFAQLKTKLASGNSPRLTQLHDEVMKVCDNLGMDGTPLTYTLDASDRRLLAVSREALMRIFTCAYAYRMTGQAKYLARAEANINTVCDFADWNAKKHFLDVGEMAAGVALGYDWLYHDLSAATKAKVVDRINKYAFYPAENKIWNLDFFAADNNWNQVCIGGLLCGALAVYEDLPGQAEKIIEKCLLQNKRAMENIYSPDGNYPEGYGYWGYGTLYQVLIIGILESCIGHDAGLAAVPGFDKTAEYMLYMEGLGGKVFNYSDGSQGAAALLAPWWFAREQHDASLLYHELKVLDAGKYYTAESRRLLPMIITFAKDVDLQTVPTPDKKVWSGHGETPVVLVRSGWSGTDADKYLGVKGGKASTSHGHMDGGSFVYDAYGVRWAMDLGNQSYAPLESHPQIGNAQLWNMGQASRRWNVFRLGHRSHGTLTVNGARHLVDGSTTITRIIDAANESGAVLDMSATLADQLSSAARTVKIVDDRDLVVIDRLATGSTRTAIVRWAMVTPAVPAIKSDHIELTLGGKTMRLSAQATEGSPAVTYNIWSTRKDDQTSGLADYDVDNPNTYIVGFEAAMDKNQTAEFTTILTPAN